MPAKRCGKFRNRSLAVTQPRVSLALNAVDAIRTILASLETEGREPTGDDAQLIARLNSAVRGADDESEADRPASAPTELEIAPGAETVRVNVRLLDELMTRVSELVLTRNQLLEMLRKTGDSQFATPLQRLSTVTAELQTGVTKTRMQPIGNAWAKLPRLVRDAAATLGKHIELRMTGADTELDRQVLELIKDPLAHMVRNAADHGIEAPAARKATAKKPCGTITLSAYHEGGRIVIAVSDDGRGLDHQRIRARAVDMGLVEPSESIQLSYSQIARFIFHPGMSTAEKVTDISGRGVGMDVVRSNIERIGGSIELKSEAGQGTAIVISIPLTLAIVPALIVNVRGQTFALPQLAVTELVRAKSNATHGIETLHGAALLRLRDCLLPVIHLAQALGLAPPQEQTKEDSYVVVFAVAGKRFGLSVDSVTETQEIVIKPLSAPLRGLSLYSGNTILGDGRVVMILDPGGLAQCIPSEAGSTASAQTTAKDAGNPATAFLLFTAGSPSPKAVRLSLVTRLEDIASTRIEELGERKLVQYRGRLMPLIELGANPETKTPDKRPAIVFCRGKESAAILVDR
ncbi:MAG TPA: chemotaxis protein CheA, partial [Burkholderiales bacterium]|nr:chemotaxis protein CheA [Burkholderiales bacterium]